MTMSELTHDTVTAETEVEAPKKKVGLCKRILKFLGSNAGLFIVLTVYTVAGAWAFIYFESGLEEEERQTKLEQEKLLNVSEHFMATYFASLHYDVDQRLDNCSYKYASTLEYVDYHHLSARTTCTLSDYDTPFCQCVR